jgi:hypothetical protein
MHCIAGLVDYALADILWARAVVLLSPTAATAGLSAQIPVAAVIDALLGNRAWTATPASVALFVLGSVAVVAGFILTAVEDEEVAEEVSTEEGKSPSSSRSDDNTPGSSKGGSGGQALHGAAVTHGHTSQPPSHFAPIQTPTAGALVPTSPRKAPTPKPPAVPALPPTSMQQAGFVARPPQQMHVAAGHAISADQEDAIVEHVLSSTPTEHPRRRGR